MGYWEKIKILLFALPLLVFIVQCKKSTEPIEKAPEFLPSFEVWSDDTQEFSGYIQLRKFANPGVQLIIDFNGEVYWYSSADTSLMRPFTPLNDRYLSLYDEKTIYEITYAGDTTLVLAYDEEGFDRPLHHEVIYDGDNIAALTKEKLVLNLDSLAAMESKTITTDGILVLNRSGDKVWHWTIADVLNPQDDPKILSSLNDWGHANSLSLDTDGNYLISWRHFNEVWKIDKTNGELIWRYGHGQVSDSSQMFYGQHSLHVNRNGEYLLLDNGHKTYRGTSRALGFKYDVESGFEQTLSISLPDSLFTTKMGSVYQFEEDKYLFSSPLSSSLLVTNRAGDILWYAKCDFQYYRAYYMETIEL